MTLKEKSKQNWKVGIQRYCAKEYDIAANRLYYALFQAAKECILQNDKKVKEKDVDHFFVQNDVSTYVHQVKAVYEVYGRMKKYRKTADYKPFSVNPEEFSQAFVQEIEKMHQELITAIEG